MTAASVDDWVGRGIDEARTLLGGGPWETTTLHGTGGALFGSSVARLRSGADSVIVKVVKRNGAGPDEPASWRRELDLYQSTWFADRLPEGLTLPECSGWAVTDDAAVILLEDVVFDDRDARSVDWYGRLANGLGQLAAVSVPDLPPWASRGFVGSEAARLMEVVSGMKASPLPEIADLVAEWRPIFDRLPMAAPRLLDWIDGVPHGFNHLDAFSRNAARVGDRMVLIDWAYAGLAPIGTDPAGIVAMTGMHGDVPSDGLAGMYRSVVGGFTSGLAMARRDLDVRQVESAIEALLVLRWVGFLGNLQGMGEALQQVVESVTGRRLVELLAAWAEMSEFVLPSAETLVGRFDG